MVPIQPNDEKRKIARDIYGFKEKSVGLFGVHFNEETLTMTANKIGLFLAFIADSNRDTQLDLNWIYSSSWSVS